jgi:hypothetical protein
VSHLFHNWDTEMRNRIVPDCSISYCRHIPILFDLESVGVLSQTCFHVKPPQGWLCRRHCQCNCLIDFLPQPWVSSTSIENPALSDSRTMTSEILDTNLDPLPIDMRNGMIAMGLFGLVSTISTFSLMSFITYRMIYWKRYYDRPIHRNQIFVLIYNLLLADFQQALSFLLSFYWLAQRKLVGGNTQCFGQGWLIQIGDVSSGLWVLAIAIHTFVNLVAQKQIRHRTFVIGVIAIWVFCLILTAIGPILSKDEFFVPAGAWVGPQHPKM